MISVRNVNQAVLLSVATVATVHPAGTVGDHWLWEVMSEDGSSVQHQTAEPAIELSLPSGNYVATAVLATAGGMSIGNKVSAEFTVAAPDVTIQTAGVLTVEMV